MSSKTGTCSDVPHHMIYLLKDARPNLHFVTGIHVKHVTKHVTFDEGVCLDTFISILERLNNFFSENHAMGVADTLNPLFHPDSPRDTRTVRGTKLVLISADHLVPLAFWSVPESATRNVLECVGVKQRVDLPGVGDNYQGSSNSYF